MLILLMATVLDPVNVFAFLPPALGKGGCPTTPKHNYEEGFDCSVFTGKNSKEKI